MLGPGTPAPLPGPFLQPSAESALHIPKQRGPETRAQDAQRLTAHACTEAPRHARSRPSCGAAGVQPVGCSPWGAARAGGLGSISELPGCSRPVAHPCTSSQRVQLGASSSLQAAAAAAVTVPEHSLTPPLPHPRPPWRARRAVSRQWTLTRWASAPCCCGADAASPLTVDKLDSFPAVLPEALGCLLPSWRSSPGTHERPCLDPGWVSQAGSVIARLGSSLRDQVNYRVSTREE